MSTKKPHGLTGKQNAKKDNPTDAIIALRCHSQSVKQWELAAEKSGKDRNKFMISTLDKESEKILNKPI